MSYKNPHLKQLFGQKFSEDQARDNHGRWSSGGGESSSDLRNDSKVPDPRQTGVVRGFHITPTSNMDNILDKGLDPSKAQESQLSTREAVYFHTSGEGAAMDAVRASEQAGESYSIIGFELPLDESKMVPEDQFEDDKSEWHISYMDGSAGIEETISPGFFRGVYEVSSSGEISEISSLQ